MQVAQANESSGAVRQAVNIRDWYSFSSCVMRLTYQRATVLQVVAMGNRYSLEIMMATRLPAHAVYPALKALQRAGFVQAKWGAKAAARLHGSPSIQHYEITDVGEFALS